MAGNKILVSADKATDADGRYVANTVVNTLSVNSEGLWRWRVVKVTNLLDITHHLILIKTHVSETGVCFRQQVKDTYSVGPNR
jgi:hypothetical protein